MKIDNTTRTNTINNINTITHQILVEEAKLPYTCCVIKATIEEKINIVIPLDTHFSVISSHIHIKRIEPTAITKPANTTVQKSVGIAAPQSILLIKYTDPIPCKKANGKVKYLVY
jgi:hypothetical protein